MTQDTSRSIEELLREHAQKIRRSTRNGWIAIAACFGEPRAIYILTCLARTP